MRLAGALDIAAAMVVWSTWGVFVRWLPVPAWAITFYAAFVSCCTAACFWMARGRDLHRLWPRSHLGPLLVMGLLFLLNNLTFLTAYERTTVANAVLTHYTAPVFVAALAPLTLGERLLPTTPVALVLAAVGMGLLLPGVELSLDDRHLQGVLLGTTSGVAYALLILMARHLSLRLPALSLIFAQNLVIAVVLLPWALPLGIPGDLGTCGWLLVLGTLHATGAGLLYLAGIRKTRAQVAAILGYLEPVGAVLWAAAVLGERPGDATLVGGGLILASGALVVWDEGRREKPVDAAVERR